MEKQVKRATVISFLLLFSGLTVALTYASGPTFSDLEDQMDTLAKTCFLVITPISGNQIITGSGFLVISQSYIFGITCNHCVPTQTPLASINVKGGKREVIQGVVITRDAINDVAIIGLGDVKKEPVIKQYGLSLFDSTDTGKSEIRYGTGLIMMGFPLNIGTQEPDTGSLIPVGRIGIVAYHRPKSATFLIDGFASYGNSGSPVVSVQTNHLLGMALGYQNDKIKLFDENRNNVAALPYNSGLAIAVTAKIISSLIKAACDSLNSTLKKK